MDLTIIVWPRYLEGVAKNEKEFCPLEFSPELVIVVMTMRVV